MNNAPLLRLEGLSVRRGHEIAVSGVGFELRAGERGWVRGANGSGKSSLALAVCGLLPISGGALQRPARVGFAPQEPRLPDRLPVLRYLTGLAALAGRDTRSARQQSAAALAGFELRPEARRLIGELSRGWRQRLSLARAWLGTPQLLVLDEPQTALDPAGMELLRENLRHYPGAVLIFAPPGTGCDSLAPVLCDLAS